MIVVHDYHNVRIAEYAVKKLLLEQEYQVLRVTERRDSEVPFNLVAWRDSERLIFIRIRSCRRGFSRQIFQSEVRYLSLILQKNKYPGNIHLWIYEESCWRQYLILLGGAIRIGEYGHGKL